MKKIFHKLSFALITAAVLLLFLHWLGVSLPAEGLASRVLAPFQKVTYAAGQKLSGLMNPWFVKKNLAAENENLAARVEELILENAKLRALKEENATLRQQLSFFEKSDYEFVMADVIGRESGLAGKKILVINRGESDGIRSGYPATAVSREDGRPFPQQFGGGFMVGKVMEAGRYSSKILLISDIQSSVAVSVHGEEDVAGVVDGLGGGSMHMDLIPADKEIEEGDLAVTSGLEDNIPSGLAVGEIGDISFRSGEFFQEASVYPLISFDTLKIVSVLVPQAQD